MRYIYRGDWLTADELKQQPCDPVRRPDGKCVTGGRAATMLVVFADGRRAVVLRRQLRVVEKGAV